VVFAPAGGVVVNSPAGLAGRREVLRTASDAEGNYVVGDPASQQVRFTIIVSYK